jgi:multiple sugar transport system permease protein/raffinose/stachyose/melibiose transport system permease protein
MLARRHIALYLSPILAFTCLFLLIPFGFAIYVSFQSWNGLSAMEFVGWQNYDRIFHDPVFIRSLRNTGLWVLSAVFLHIPLGLLLALILSKRPRGWKFFRTAFFLPNVISSTALALMWYFIFHVNLGLLNGFLRTIGLESLQRPWLNDLKTALLTTQVPFILYVGVTMVIFLMQITTISPDLYEAAEIDGATSWQKDRFITIPLLAGTVAVNIIFNVTACLRMFEYPLLITGGGPAKATMNISLYIYSEMMSANRYGVSLAAGVLTILFGVLVIGVLLKAVRMLMGRG